MSKYRKHWSEEEVQYLQDYYGVYSMKNLVKVIGRTESQIIAKARRLHLNHRYNSGKITTVDLARAIGKDRGTVAYWCKTGKLKATSNSVLNRKIYTIQLKDFWKFAEKNKSKINFHKIERNILGKEPEWVEEERKKGNVKLSNNHNKKWTKEEDALITFYWQQGKTGKEIGEILNRKTDAVLSRARKKLKLKPRSIHLKWTEIEIEMLIDMVENKKMMFKEIAIEMGRSFPSVFNKYTELKKLSRTPAKVVQDSINKKSS